MSSQLRVDNILPSAGTALGIGTASGSITFNSSNISGDVIFNDDVTVNGVLTYEDVTNVDSVGIITAQAGVKIPDSQKIFLGSGDDLQIYHDGTDSWIDNTEGDLYLRTTGSGDDIIIRAKDDVLIQTQASEGAIIARGDGQVELYHNNVKKFETTSTGVKIDNSSTTDMLLLDVSGTNFAKIGHNSASGTNILDVRSEGHIRLLTGGNNERLRIDSSGRLLIGRTSTSHGHPLQVQAASGANAIAIQGRSVDDQSEITFYENDNSTILGQIQHLRTHSTYRSRVGYLRFDSGGVTEKMRLDSSGNLLLGEGHTTASNLAGGFTKRLSIEGTGAANSSIGLVRNANDDNPPYIYLGKSRGTSAGSNTVIGNGDTIGMVNFAGSRGSSTFGDAVNLRAIADSNFSGSSSPGRFSVWTTPVNSTSPLESFQVNSAGAITAPRNVSWSYSRANNGSSWGANSSCTYPNLQYRTPIPLFGTSSTIYDTHNALSKFTVGNGQGIKFTAPVGGKYLVVLNMSSVKNNTDADWGSIGLMRNTTAQASTGSLDYMMDTMYFPDSTSDNNQLGWGGSVIVSLSQNDYIVPYSMSVEKFSSDNQYYFQGYLLG